MKRLLPVLMVFGAFLFNAGCQTTTPAFDQILGSNNYWLSKTDKETHIIFPIVQSINTTPSDKDYLLNWFQIKSDLDGLWFGSGRSDSNRYWEAEILIKDDKFWGQFRCRGRHAATGGSTEWDFAPVSGMMGPDGQWEFDINRSRLDVPWLGWYTASGHFPIAKIVPGGRCGYVDLYFVKATAYNRLQTIYDQQEAEEFLVAWTKQFLGKRKITASRIANIQQHPLKVRKNNRQELERRFIDEKKRKTEEAKRVAEAATRRKAEVTARLKEEKKRQQTVQELARLKAEKAKKQAILQSKMDSEKPDDVAVIIANSNYKKLGKDIPNVDPAYNDAKNIKKYFMESLGVREGNIIYLKDATGAQLMEVFGNKDNHKAQLFNWVKPNKSNVYVYYAGHGAPASKDGSAFLVPTDAKSQTIEFSGYPLTNLYRNLGKIKARSVTVILEACFSGSSQAGALLPRSSGITITPKEPTVPSNVKVISAGAADQMASWEKDESQSLFTKYFLLAMRGEGDKKPYGNGDGKVQDKELQNYLDDTMTYFARRYYGRDQRVQIVKVR